MDSRVAEPAAAPPTGLGTPARPAAAEPALVRAAGVRRDGRGRPLLLVNGLLHGQDLWDPMVRRLAKDRQTVRFDFPHQNGSGLADDYNSFERYCDFVQDLLDALGLDPSEVDAFGFSIGGDTLRTLAVERGLRFRRLILCACAPAGVERYWRAFFTGAQECLRQGQLDAFVRLVAFQLYSPLYIERYPKLLNVMHIKCRQRFPDLRRLEQLLALPLQRGRPDPGRDAVLCGSAAVIHGVHDQLAPFGLARAHARQAGLPVSAVDCGHTLLAEAPDEVARLAERILQRVAAPHKNRP